jgi:YidC/Oxa1 family membrane protein insertase
LWWFIFGRSIDWVLHHLYGVLAGVPFANTIGAYGLAIILMTIVIKLILAPLYQFQITRSRKMMDQQRKLAPELAALRKKYKNDRQRLNDETMKLYQAHGVNPLGQFSGCLPAVLQMPILLALYYVFLGAAQHGFPPGAHFLFVPNLNDSPGKHPLFNGLPIPTFTYAIIPLLAAVTTFVQSKMIQQPPHPLATEQELQTQQVTQTMQFAMPVMIAYFAVLTPAGLGLYWFISNCVAIIQQYFVTGWGSLRPKRAEPAPAARRGLETVPPAPRTPPRTPPKKARR